MENTAYRAIAIVGAGAILPDAPNVPAFWENVKNGRYSISEVKPDRWDPALYYDPDHSAPDKTYSKIGGWVREYPWDPMKWHLPIPPRVADCHGWVAEMGDRLHPRSAGRLRLSQASAGPGSHRGDPGQCHGRGKALSHRVAHVLSGIRARIGGKRQFRRAAGSDAPRHHPRIARAHRQASAPRLPKTACPANWPTALPAALRTSSTFTARTTFATPRAHRRWRRSAPRSKD